MIDLKKRYLKQNAFKPQSSDFKILKVDENWGVYNNANMSIHVTDKCNADCGFCIANLRYLNEGLVYLKPEIKEDEIYYKRLDDILKITKKINPSVSITGGEQTIHPDFEKMVNYLSNAPLCKKIILCTNAVTVNHTDLKDGASFDFNLSDRSGRSSVTTPILYSSLTIILTNL